MKIPFFNYPALFQQKKDLYMSTIEGVLSRGAYIMQKDLFDFEENLARYLGVKHAIGTADGTMSMLLSLKATGIGQGDEVIVPSHTFVATAAAVHHCGAKPILVDCGPDHLIDTDSVARAITKNTKAVMPVQLNGRTANMDGILKLAEAHDLMIIEDSCQALGSKFKGRFAGTFGLSGSFSFYPSKTLGCFGDGGAVITNDDAHAAEVRLLRDHGRNEQNTISRFGFNSRLDNVQAAILNLKLAEYDVSIGRRREIATRYQDQLGGLEEMILPPAPDSDPNHFDIYQNYEAEARHRDGLRDYLAEKGVGTIVQWGGHGIHQFEELGYQVNLEGTQRVMRDSIMLPMHTALTNDEVDYICETITTYYQTVPVLEAAGRE